MQELRALNQPNPEAAVEHEDKSTANQAKLSATPVHHLR